MMDESKVKTAIRLLQSFKGKEIELSFSGGKDSCVILELAKMAQIPYRAIYKNTTIDPPGTIQFCKDLGVEVIEPKKSFFTIIEENGNGILNFGSQHQKIALRNLQKQVRLSPLR